MAIHQIYSDVYTFIDDSQWEKKKKNQKAKLLLVIDF